MLVGSGLKVTNGYDKNLEAIGGRLHYIQVKKAQLRADVSQGQTGYTVPAWRLPRLVVLGILVHTRIGEVAKLL